MTRLLLILITISFVSCSNKNLQEYKDFEPNFSKQEIILIDKMVVGFESFLKNQYQSDPDNSYKLYLEDVATMNVKYYDYKEKEKLIQEIKNSSLFSKIWIPCPIEEEDNSIVIAKKNDIVRKEKDDNDFYCLNTKGKYFDFIKSQTKNAELDKLYTTLVNTSDINTTLYAVELLKILKQNDYKDIKTKTNISIAFYYDLILNLKQE